jgi:hypothetical protein
MKAIGAIRWAIACRSRQTPKPVLINLDNVITIERQGDLTTVVMLGGETIYVDTMSETLIGAVAPAGPV